MPLKTVESLWKLNFLIPLMKMTTQGMRAQGAFTPDANDANKSRYLREVERLNILSLLAPFAREIHYTTDGSLEVETNEMYISIS